MREWCSFFTALISVLLLLWIFASRPAIARDNTVLFDFDGDGKTDISLYRPGIWTQTVRGTSHFYVRNSSTGDTMVIPFGAGGDRPAVADYDLDGKADVAIFRSWEDTLKVPWEASDYWIRYSSTGQTEVIYHFGYGTVINRNFVEDGRPELGVFTHRVLGDPTDPCYIDGFLLASGINLFQKDITEECSGGWNRRMPALGDYNNDGYSDAAIFVRNFVVRGSSYYEIWPSPFVAGYTEPPIVRPFDIELIAPGDYDADGKTDLAGANIVQGRYRWKIEFSSTGELWQLPWGIAGDKIVPGDYDGDGKTDPAVFRPSDGTWYIFRSSDWGWEEHQWGLGTDIPIPEPNSF